MKTARIQHWWLGAAAAFFLALLFSVLDISTFGLESRSLDLRFQLRGPRPVTQSPLILVEVDNRSYKDLNERYPFPRTYLARVLRNLKRAGVSLIVLDIQFTEQVKGDEQGLLDLAAAVRDCGPVVMSGELVQEKHGYQRIDYPLPELLATGQPWGLVNDLGDPDGVYRRYPLYLPTPGTGTAFPSLGIRALQVLDSLLALTDDSGAGAATGAFGDIENGSLVMGSRRILLDPGWANAIRINYYGPAGTFPAYSFSDIMDDSGFELADPDMDADYMEQWWNPDLYQALWGDAPHPFQGKVAIIGVSATDRHDDKRTPFYSTTGDRQLMPGVEVHAHALQTIMDQTWVVNPLVGWRAFILLALMAVLGAWITARLGPLRGLLVLVPMEVLWLVSAQAAFNRQHLWLEVVAPTVAVGAAWMAGMLLHFLQARRERAQIRGMFAQYVPEAVVAELIRNPELLVLGGEEREMSALFSDVEGFTSISEHLSPTELVELLNEFLTDMTQCITDEGGIIDKYEGDAIIAEFGAPLPCQDHAARAVRAALHMQQNLALLREGWAAQGRPLLKARIGINSGMMVVGNMGSRQIFDYTAMGDAMNLAARLEPANKQYGSYVLVSGNTWAQIEGFVGRCLDTIRVKGRREAVDLWEVLCHVSDPAAAPLEERVRLWGEARALYLERDFTRARQAFLALAERTPDDDPARTLAERCRNYEENPPPVDWDGVRVMTEK